MDSIQAQQHARMGRVHGQGTIMDRGSMCSSSPISTHLRNDSLVHRPRVDGHDHQRDAAGYARRERRVDEPVPHDGRAGGEEQKLHIRNRWSGKQGADGSVHEGKAGGEEKKLHIHNRWSGKQSGVLQCLATVQTPSRSPSISSTSSAIEKSVVDPEGRQKPTSRFRYRSGSGSREPTEAPGFICHHLTSQRVKPCMGREDANSKDMLKTIQ